MWVRVPERRNHLARERAALINLLPTMMPSASPPTFRAYSGVLMPKPTTSGWLLNVSVLGGFNV
jgi:hypothetical protein|tara:strand:+ start:71 stop:262 length:192 start_codon:yes stop_codon:yes gene_type:complete